MQIKQWEDGFMWCGVLFLTFCDMGVCLAKCALYTFVKKSSTGAKILSESNML